MTDLEYELETFDPDEDIILPNSIWGEIVYIYFIIKEMIRHPETREIEWIRLKRQIRFFKRWMQVNKE